jgi:hypothetical protein
MKQPDKVLYKAVPSFWKDNFTDSNFVEAIFQGVMARSSELYIRGMALPLNMSVHNCVDRYRPDVRFIPIRSTSTVKIGGRWYCSLPYDISIAGLLQGSVEGAGTVLEQRIDYNVYKPSELDSDILDATCVLDVNLPTIEFFANPFTTITGAYESEERTLDNYFLPKSGMDSTFFDSLEEEGTVYIASNTSLNEYTEHLIALKLETPEESLEAGIYFESSSPAPFAGTVRAATTAHQHLLAYTTSFHVEVEAVTYPVDVVYLTAKTPYIDKYYLHDLYGWFFSDVSKLSTDDYKRSLIAKFMYRTKPFTKEILRSCISLFLNLPVIKGSDEHVLDVLFLSGKKRVNTTGYSYEVPDSTDISDYIIKRSRNVDGVANVDYESDLSLVLAIDTAVGEPYKVYDIESTEDWWFGDDVSIPLEYAPGLKEHGRNAVKDSTLFDNEIGTNTTTEAACIGDYTIVIGETKRQRVAYAAARDFYRYTMVVAETENNAVVLGDLDKKFLIDNAPKDVILIFK